MILCDFEDLNNEEFHLKFFDSVVQGNIELVQEVLSHPKLSTQFDISYKNYYCIIASILNSQQINNHHLDFLKLFTSSPLLKKHANPSLCSQEDIFGGALGNAIIFTPIETIRFIGKFFNDKTSNLQELLNLTIFNNKKEAFFYLVRERQFIIQKPDLVLKTLANFSGVDEEIIKYINNLLTNSSIENNTNSNKKDKVSTDLRKGRKSFLLNVSNMKQTKTTHYWGSKFKQNF